MEILVADCLHNGMILSDLFNLVCFLLIDVIVELKSVIFPSCKKSTIQLKGRVLQLVWELLILYLGFIYFYYITIPKKVIDTYIYVKHISMLTDKVKCEQDKCEQI